MRRASVLGVLILAIVILFVSGVVVWMLSDVQEGSQRVAPTIQEDTFIVIKDDTQSLPDYDLEYMRIEAMTQSFCSDPYAITQCQATCDGALWEVPSREHGFADCEKKCCAIEYKEEPEQDKEFEEER
jgi:hypothetical protein